MKKCNIIIDLLPLYLDELCSKDTNDFIENHLRTCKKCTNALKELKEDIVIPSTKDKDILKKISQKLKNKYFKIVMICLVIFFGLIITWNYAINNIYYTNNYNENIEIYNTYEIDYNDNWNINIKLPYVGRLKSLMIKPAEESIIFVTVKSNIREYFYTKKLEWEIKKNKENTTVGITTTIEIDYKNLTEHYKIYYTKEDFNKIKNATKEELNSIINSSVLIFEY